MKWFEFFLANIPPARPVLLIMDGHGTHMSIELIELARSNDVHLLCLPSHTTHVANPGRIVTSDKLASLIADAWPLSLTLLNIMSGFKKTGIYPINPGEVIDRQLAPLKLFDQLSTKSSQDPGSASNSPTKYNVLKD